VKFYQVKFKSFPQIGHSCEVYSTNYSNYFPGNTYYLELFYFIKGNLLLHKENGAVCKYENNILLCRLPDFVGNTSSDIVSCHYRTVGIRAEFDYTLYNSDDLKQADAITLIQSCNADYTFLLPHPDDNNKNFSFAKPYIDKIIKSYNQQLPGKNMECLSLLFSMFHEITTFQAQLIMQSQKADSYQMIINYIEKNLSQSLSLDMIASHANISKSHLCRIFRSQCNSTVNQYIIKRRMEIAGNLAIENSQTAVEIARAVGINDPFYFYKLFLKYYGVHFSQYRQFAVEKKPPL